MTHNPPLISRHGAPRQFAALWRLYPHHLPFPRLLTCRVGVAVGAHAAPALGSGPTVRPHPTPMFYSTCSRTLLAEKDQ